jgi:hypothetical protein
MLFRILQHFGDSRALVGVLLKIADDPTDVLFEIGRVFLKDRIDNEVVLG